MMDLEDAYEIGRENKRAISLLANHCLNANLNVRVSPVGRQVGLPIGMAEIRCPHAPFFGESQMDGVDLAVRFYEQSCLGCPHQRPSGLLPTIASEVEGRRQEREREDHAALQAVRESRAQWELRQAARDQAIAGELYPARDLKERIDLLDPDPACEKVDEDRVFAARRKVVEVARATPELFTTPLVETIVVLADSADPTAHVVLLALATLGFFPVERATQIGARTLAQHALPEAGELVVAFAAKLSPAEIADACFGAIVLTAEPDRFYRHGWAEPRALVALAAVAWPTVRDAVVAALRDDDDERREIAAHAARHLLVENVGRLAELGQQLVRAIRHRDTGYAGQPQPGAAVIRALSQAWPLDPAAVATVVEAGAASLDEDGRERLVGIARSVLRRSEGEPLSDDALSAAVDFLIDRLDGSWGASASTAASDDLTHIARDRPGLVLPHVGSLFGQLLKECQPEPSGLILVGVPRPQLDMMERSLARQRRGRLRADIAETIGLLARAGSKDAVNRTFTLLTATTGDSESDVITRSVLLDVLTNSVTTDNVASIIPRLYTALLSTEQVVRAGAIQLWESCARIVKTLPTDLESLLPALLLDTFVIVHGTIARAMPRLNVSDDARRNALGALQAIATAHRNGNREVLRDALNTLLWSAEAWDAVTAARAALFVINESSPLDPLERERVLLQVDLIGHRATSAWGDAALDVLAHPDRSGIVGREDRLIAAFLTTPKAIIDIPLARFEEIALAYVPDSLAHAAELLEVLQAAGRWRDAASLATSVVQAIDETTEQSGRRTWFSAIAGAVEAEAIVREGGVPQSIVSQREDQLTGAFWIHTQARFAARDAIVRLAASDPMYAVQILDEAASIMDGTPGGDVRVDFYINVLHIAAQLLRYDAAMRNAEADAERFILAAKRNAQALRREATAVLAEADPIVLFAARVVAAGDANLDEVIAVAAAIPVAVPLSDEARYAPRRGKKTKDVSTVEPLVELEELPVIVCIPRLNKTPIVDTVILRPEMAHDLALEMRMEAWPRWADRCDIELLSALPPDALDVPKLQLQRAQGKEDAYGLRFSAKGTLRFLAARPVGSDPVDLPIHARFVSADGRTEAAIVAGYERLRVMPYDPTRHALTDRIQIDERLLLMYDELLDDRTLNEDDVRAFCRFFTSCVSAARILMFNKEFCAGTRVSEAQFHDALEKLLQQDPELGGRLTRRNRLGGGFDDLLHDSIVAELKVVKNKQKPIEGRARYIAQPTQYAVDLGSRLSILIVLDHSPKNMPPRVLENDFRWEYPQQHGDADARYPSRVGVLTINTNWPVPSAFSKKPNPTRNLSRPAPVVTDDP